MAVIMYYTDVLWSVLLILFTILITKYVLERRSLLAKLPPGPMGLPLIGYLPFLGKDAHLTYDHLAKKYGNIFSLRLGASVAVVLNDYQLAKDVLSHPAAQGRYSGVFDFFPTEGFHMLNGKEWEEQRKFNMKLMKELGLGRATWENLIQGNADGFIGYLESNDDKPVDVTNVLCQRIGASVLSLLLGRQLEVNKEVDEVELAVEYNRTVMTATAPSRAICLVPGLRQFMELFRIGNHQRIKDLVSSFSSFLKKEISKHKRASDTTEDFIHLYLEKIKSESLINSETSFTEDRLEGNVNIIFLGAVETVLSSLTWLFRLMAAHSKVQEEVHREIDRVLGCNGLIRYIDRSKIPYTLSVIMESQRYSSIVVIPDNRKATGDIAIRGYVIPKGTRIITNLWAIHHDCNYWEDPHIFNPKRFLIEDKELKLKSDIPSYMPFSAGRRKCPGDMVAMMEILIFFVSVMQKFTVVPAQDSTIHFEEISGLVSHLKPQSLCFLKRS